MFLVFFNRVEAIVKNDRVHFWLLSFLILLWFLSMVAWPLYKYQLDFQKLMLVWDRWQPLNVGLLAFTASVIAFMATQMRVKRERDTSYNTARLSLVNELSLLSAYLLECDTLLLEFSNWEKSKKEGAERPKFNLPQMPLGCSTILLENIKNSDDEEEIKCFKTFIRMMQIYDARLCRINDRTAVIYELSLQNFVNEMCEVYWWVQRLFIYSRNEERFQDISLEQAIKDKDETVNSVIGLLAKNISRTEKWFKLGEEGKGEPIKDDLS